MFNLVMKTMRRKLLEELEQVRLALIKVLEVQQLLLVDSKLLETEESMD